MRSSVHCVPRLVDTEAAAGREEYNKSATDNLPALSSPARLLADLVGLEPLGSRAIELVAGVPGIDFSHKQTSICDHYRKRKKNASGRRTSFGKVRTGEERKKEKKKKNRLFSPGVFNTKL